MDGRSVEILIVEDNPHDLELTLHAFKKYHLANNIQIARDGEEALEYIFCTGRYHDRANVDQPRIILLDLKLPGIDGLEVLEKLKSDARTRGLPVVMLTSSEEERDIVESYHLGVNSYIVKPVDFNQFTEIVRKLGFYWLLINSIRPGQMPIDSPGRSD
jgi:two-component system, response regulator